MSRRTARPTKESGIINKLFYENRVEHEFVANKAHHAGLTTSLLVVYELIAQSRGTNQNARFLVSKACLDNKLQW